MHFLNAEHEVPTGEKSHISRPFTRMDRDGHQTFAQGGDVECNFVMAFPVVPGGIIFSRFLGVAKNHCN
jgi:hypothetical protein